VLHVLLAGFDEFWQFVVTLFEQHVDVGPRFCGIMLQIDQPVVDQDGVHDHEQDRADQNETAYAHNLSSRS
jgi:hypothetical protein